MSVPPAEDDSPGKLDGLHSNNMEGLGTVGQTQGVLYYLPTHSLSTSHLATKLLRIMCSEMNRGETYLIKKNCPSGLYYSFGQKKRRINKNGQKIKRFDNKEKERNE